MVTPNTVVPSRETDLSKSEGAIFLPKGRFSLVSEHGLVQFLG